MTLEQDAKEVRERLKVELKERGFPNGCCKIAAIEINRKGYEIVMGYAKLDNYCLTGKPHNQMHYWNYDPVTGREFDITASQFNIHLKDHKFPDIAVWKPGQNPLFSLMHKSEYPHEVL